MQKFKTIEEAEFYIVLLQERIKILETETKTWSQKYHKLNNYLGDVSLSIAYTPTMN